MRCLRDDCEMTSCVESYMWIIARLRLAVGGAAARQGEGRNGPTGVHVDRGGSRLY